MGLVLKPSEVKSAAQQIRTNINDNKTGYGNALQVIQRFAENEDLNSESWNTAKFNMSVAHQLIMQGMQAAKEAILQDLNTLEASIGEEDLDEDELIADIERLTNECICYEEAIRNLQRMGARSILNGYAGIQTAIGNYKALLEHTRAELELMKEKLEKLRETSQITAELLNSSEPLLQAIENAINDAEVYITGAGTFSDGKWRMVILQEIEALKENAALEKYLKDELGIELDEFEEMYGEETVKEIQRYMEKNMLGKISENNEEALDQYILSKTCDCTSVSAENGKYQLRGSSNNVMYELDRSEIKDVVMNMAFANQEVKKEYIADYLKQNLNISDVHVAAIMGNMQAESGLSPLKAQNVPADDLYNPEYIENYNINDGVGWGLIQWAHHSRKQGLYKYVSDDNGNCNVGNMDKQLEYLVIELESGAFEEQYKKFLQITDLDEATEYFCDQIEGAGIKRLEERKDYAETIYTELFNK